jgi:hypothetical protein
MIVVPIGYKVKFKLNGQVLEGKVTKIMVPGYVFKHMPGADNRMRYCIEILNDSKNNCVIFDDQLLDPNYDRLCNDEDYREQLKLKFEEFHVSERNNKELYQRESNQTIR